MAQNKKKTAKFKKTQTKPLKKTLVKSAKKTAKNPAKKAAMKTSNKSAKSAAKKTAKKIAKKPIQKNLKKALSKPTAKVTQKQGAQKPVAQKPVENIIWDQFITPLDDRLIVEIASNERTTPSGLLFIPDTVADTSGNFQAKVLVAGRGHLEKNGKVRPMDVQQGDTVVFAGFAGTKVNINGKDLTILRESEVLGIVRK